MFLSPSPLKDRGDKGGKVVIKYKKTKEDYDESNCHKQQPPDGKR
jgi:hypothetical protein